MGLVGARVPPPSKGEYEEMIRAAARRHLAMGITTATDAGVTPEILDVYRAMTLPYRVNVMALRRPLGSDEVFPLPEKVDSPFLRVDTVKFIADGGLSGATAALREPYRHDGSRGLLRIDAEEMVELSREACEKGLRLAVHVIGDAAIDAALEALESLAVSVGLPLAPRLEHFGLPDAVQLRRARALGAVAVPQAIFIEALGVNFRAYLSESMLARAYPIRAMLDEGLGVALSSDAPVVGDESPLRGIRAALERRDDEGVAIAPEQAISLEEGFRAYTVGGAQASGDGDNRGRLAPGMWADFAVLSEDPRTADALARVKVEATFVGGERAF
jgi:predicted amidohydrolase YtcJ